VWYASTMFSRMLQVARRVSRKVVLPVAHRGVKRTVMFVLCGALFLSLLAYVAGQKIYPVFADVDCQGDSTCMDLSQKISNLQHDLELSVNATTPLEKTVTDLQGRIKAAQAEIDQAKKDAADLSSSIDERQSSLADNYKVFTQRVRARYERSVSFNPLVMLLASGSAADFTRQLEYQRTIEEADQRTITSIGAEIVQLEADKQKLEQKQAQLAGLQADLDKQVGFFNTEIGKAKAYQATLQGQISALSSQQQAILSAKTGTFQTSVGDVPLADDFNASPAFNPGFSPAFAAFSFGAPHFKGLSQYGAFGRAKSGQNAETILNAYYGGGIQINKNYNTNIQIKVDGYGSVDLETYVKRIYEMPASWGDQGGMEALKAQAVAARSYALASTNNGAGSICATEACQVYQPQNKGGNWDAAVDATKGWVLEANGQPFSAWYASTSGGYQQSYSYNGYSTPGFWDTSNGQAGWTSQAYEKIAGSPWFYKAWYRDRSGDACGKSHPWLTEQEMSDILNAWIVLSQTSDSRIAPLGGCWGGNPYSMDELRDKANSLGGAVTSISSVSVVYSNNGYTATVHFGTNKGDVSISGSEFQNVFNLRAPGRISLKSGLFNVERR
jgi:peptidoglycan hydrolase-like amidase